MEHAQRLDHEAAPAPCRHADYTTRLRTDGEVLPWCPACKTYIEL
jgi:hypothetical protein